MRPDRIDHLLQSAVDELVIVWKAEADFAGDGHCPGGILVNGRLGPSIINGYEFIDFIIQGEGEYPLNALVGQLEEKDFEATERTDGDSGDFWSDI